ncbi:purple acid phosphatase family protein [Arthrospiribacter ruber]|uniref:acid phosphatase n=1 Tax=Arthrospiribacter ruber TaxID=2487934 RepID=A0A951J1R0_9BACT|nr:tartrate-resistant acid phosphatase type 5 family protein [Arthrospiribacter ruber]MBW3466800.1 acid phosphatase [Arthrospiribacter ruber]MBW3469592.1 acid phosphatase [Arthrospiribacter ruber]MBW3470333.1 acid phosphatase [Arthrospiribacter ruber]
MLKRLLIFCLIFSGLVLRVESQTIDPTVRSNKFIVIGDWGRNGDDQQLEVADQLLHQVKKYKPDFIISSGDNFYPNGVRSILDPLWKYSFEDIYKSYHLQIDWYAILGNHDYLGDPDAQVEYSRISRRWNMPDRYYSKTIPIKGSRKKALFIYIDTNSLIPEFYANSIYGPNVAKSDSLAQKKWMKKLIEEEDDEIAWKIVVGHHPVYTGGRTNGYDTRSIRKSLENLLRHSEVDLYISGHDHSLQYLEHNGIKQVISGSASEVTQSDTLPYTKFTASEPGFILFSLTEEKIEFDVINKSGVTLYHSKIEK